MSNLNTAIDMLDGIRKYTTQLLATIPESDWFRQPAEGITHVGWQAGHLAIAQFRLILVRVFAYVPGQDDLISESEIKLFGKDSMPTPDPAAYPSPGVILEMMEHVHQRTMKELPTLSSTTLEEPSLPQHRSFQTKFGAIMWCGNHEMLHVGQIGLLRRLLGHKPTW